MSSNIDIYRNGVLIATVPNIPGFYTDSTGQKGKATFTYKVCAAGTQNCSSEVTVRFGGGGAVALNPRKSAIGDQLARRSLGEGG